MLTEKEITALFEAVLSLDLSAALTKNPHNGLWEVWLHQSMTGPNEFAHGHTIAEALHAAQTWLLAHPKGAWLEALHRQAYAGEQKGEAC